MAALNEDEIGPGVVAWLDQVLLNDTDAVTKTTPHLGVPEPRPFVCFARDGDDSSWAPITTQHRAERLRLSPEWLTGGGPGWKNRPQYIVDGANTYNGPNAEFIAASAGDFSKVGSRSGLTDEGLAAVVAEVERQVRRRR